MITGHCHTIQRSQLGMFSLAGIALWRIC